VVATILITLLAGAGCEILPKPEIPKPITLPNTEVLQVRKAISSAEAARYEITLRLTNPNDFALPLTNARYTLSLGGEGYTGAALPNSTLPASGVIDVKLPAVILADQIGPNYTVRGDIEMLPPGQVKQLGYDMGVPQPTVPFRGSGAVIQN
jgi:hypothetical protein